MAARAARSLWLGNAERGGQGQVGVAYSRGASLTLLTELRRREYLLRCLLHPNRPVLDEVNSSSSWIWRKRLRNSLLSPRLPHMSGSPHLTAVIEFPPPKQSLLGN